MFILLCYSLPQALKKVHRPKHRKDFFCLPRIARSQPQARHRPRKRGRGKGSYQPLLLPPALYRKRVTTNHPRQKPSQARARAPRRRKPSRETTRLGRLSSQNLVANHLQLARLHGSVPLVCPRPLHLHRIANKATKARNQKGRNPHLRRRRRKGLPFAKRHPRRARRTRPLGSLSVKRA